MQSFKNVGTSLMIAGVLMLTAAGKVQAFFSLDFEGIGDGKSVSDYYEKSYGIDFTSGAMATVAYNAGGNGDFAFEPSPVTAVHLLDSSFTMNVQGGFKGGLFFYYSAPFLNHFNSPLTVDIYSDLNDLEPPLLHHQLDQTPLLLDDSGNPVGDAYFNDFVWVELTFSGTAKYVVFSGPVTQAFFDNISDVPTPGTGLLMGLGLAELGVFRKRFALQRNCK